MDLGIKGRVAVVTGAKSGMGRSTAEHLLREGVHRCGTGGVRSGSRRRGRPQ
jgi:NAD(P)-dependent dehydrogenase (short-subunit alcohol dehydrogenase family)